MRRRLESALRERSRHFSFTSVGDGANPPFILNLQKAPFLPEIIKECFLGRSHSFPIDQPLEGNISQIHPNLKKPNPTQPNPHQERTGGNRTSQGNYFHWRRRRDFYLWTSLTMSSDVRNGEEPGKQIWLSPLLPRLLFSCGFLCFCSV